MPRRARRGCTYEAYLPDRLCGAPLTIDAEVAADVADAERQIATLPAHGSGLATLEALARFLLRAEAAIDVLELVTSAERGIAAARPTPA